MSQFKFKSGIEIVPPVPRRAATAFREPSSEGAKECSSRRKPWGADPPPSAQAPEGRKKRPSGSTSAVCEQSRKPRAGCPASRVLCEKRGRAPISTGTGKEKPGRAPLQLLAPLRVAKAIQSLAKAARLQFLSTRCDKAFSKRILVHVPSVVCGNNAICGFSLAFSPEILMSAKLREFGLLNGTTKEAVIAAIKENRSPSGPIWIF